MKIKSLLAALSLVGLASAATGASLTYNVSRLIGIGSVAGTVTTDGTFGVLATANVTAWSLTLNDGLSMFAMTEANSEFAAFGSGLTADVDSMDFNFSAANVAFLFSNPAVAVAQNSWCANGVGGVTCQFVNSQEVVALGTNPRPGAVRQGPTEIASRTVATVNAVPEPTSLALVGLALLGAAAARRRA